MNKENKSNCTRKTNASKDITAGVTETAVEMAKSKVKFEIYGEEMIEKIVKLSGNSGRVYLPPTWVGHSVKIIRID